MQKNKKLIAVFIPIIIAIVIANQHKSGNEDITPSPSSSATAKPSVALSILDSSRVTKKPFGLFATPKDSPVQPERFSGYHSGTDFETTSAEANIDVSVPALCEGPLVVKKQASGYGGVIVQSCTLSGQAVTVIYGHIDLQSVTTKKIPKKGDILAVLGKGYSTETDGERKHLHLGIHKGTAINILGYVQTESALKDWLNPEDFIK